MIPLEAIGKKRVFGLAAVTFLLLIGLFGYGLTPANSGAEGASGVFEVQKGEGARAVIAHLASEGLIRSVFAFEIYSFLGGRALAIKPGLYRLSPAMSANEILNTITGGHAGTVTVRIPEGATIYQVDALLSNALVIRPGDLLAFAEKTPVEGMLFPDTYNFYTNGNINDVVKKMTDRFEEAAGALLAKDSGHAKEDLIVASLIEKEVPDLTDQKIVSGIIWKRLKAGVALDIDATICYVKAMQHPGNAVKCYPLTTVDYETESPYNTYLHKGLPPGPVGNPGISAITAALTPKSSPYWYYLSDPKTGKTIFAVTLDEQNQNRVIYLGR